MEKEIAFFSYGNEYIPEYAFFQQEVAGIFRFSL